MSFSEEMKMKIWKKAPAVSRKDPAKYRKDPYGNELCWDSYGKFTDKGWEIDHIKPKAKGGNDTVVNLQVLQTKINRAKRDDLRKRSRHSASNK